MKKVIIFLACVFVAISVECFSVDSIASRDLGVSFRVSSEEFHPGDIVYIYVDIHNPTQETFKEIPLFAVWAAGSELKPQNAFYFPPPADGISWLPEDVRYYKVDVSPGTTEIELLAPIVWPDSPSGYSAAPLVFFTGMSDPHFEKVFGTSDWLTLYLY